MNKGFITVGRIVVLATLAALPTSVVAADRSASIGTETYRLPAIETYREVVERPLFAPDRRPAPVAVDAGLATAVVLTGVILLPQARYAVIKEGTAPVRSVAEGTHLSVGTIERITRDGISLRLTDGRVAAMTVVRPASARPTAVAQLSSGGEPAPTPRPTPPYAGKPAVAGDGARDAPLPPGTRSDR